MTRLLMRTAANSARCIPVRSPSKISTRRDRILLRHGGSHSCLLARGECSAPDEYLGDMAVQETGLHGVAVDRSDRRRIQGSWRLCLAARVQHTRAIDVD